MPEMFQTKIWDDVLDKYVTDLTAAAAFQIVPYDIQVKVGPFGAMTGGVTAHADLAAFQDDCFFGAIILAENDRFMALELDDEGEAGAHLSEVNVDNTDLLETHVILYDNATVGTAGAVCPNAYKNKKPYKELQMPIKILPYNATSRRITYSILINLRYPTDPNGNMEPPLNYQWLPLAGSGAVAPYALIVMPSLAFVKPDCIKAPPAPSTICPTTVNMLLQ